MKKDVPQQPGVTLPWVPPTIVYPQPADLVMTDKAHAHGSYSAFRAQGWTDEQLVDHGYAIRSQLCEDEGCPQSHIPHVCINNSPESEIKKLYWARVAKQLADAARKDDIVVTVEQVPCEPLKMGNHRDVVTVREVRK